MKKRNLCTAVLFIGLCMNAMAADCQKALDQIGPVAMQLPVAQFDEDESKGWRALRNQGCFAEAAQLIEYFALGYDSDYRRLKWHLAQMQALAGKTNEALAAARLSISPVQEQLHPDFDWNDYVLATVAFLQKDRPTFEAHRSALKDRASRAPSMLRTLRSSRVWRLASRSHTLLQLRAIRPESP